MGEITLFEHNEIAYRKLCNLLETSKYATINHATGTGKSFIALKYLYEHRDKKYLYITPTYPIIKQLLDDCSKIGINPEELNFDQIIYRNLLDMSPEQLFEQYDGFILDEYHRAGARETYKKIKDLKQLIDEDREGSKKIIGLTATPTRYLDRERNMTNEIFDGNVASEITLAQAMIDELLPIPTYINTKFSCLSEYEKLVKKVDRLAPGKRKNEIRSRLKELLTKIQEDETSIKGIVAKHETTSKGKFIVFCDNIQDAEKYYRESDSWFGNNGEYTKYIVHSLYKNNDIQRALDDFNKNNEGISALFCVDILNEGVHVSGVNRAIILRRTFSPIIYFQQIGRVLSYSGRKGEPKIYDLVTNFSNHEAIYAVYDEFKQEILKRIEQHPELTEYYSKKLEKFKILDETRDILQQLHNIEKEITPEVIIESEINHSIDFLEKYLKGRKSSDIFVLDSNCKSQAVRDAYFTLVQNAKYVTNAQFDRIKELNMFLPAEFMMTKEERLQYLNGAESIFDKENRNSENSVRMIINFIEKNNKRPNSKIPEEERIELEFLKYLAHLTDEQKLQIITTFEENEIELEVWEKLLLDVPINTEEDFDVLMVKAEQFLSQEVPLPEYMKVAVENAIYNYNSGRHRELFEILDKSAKLDRNINEEKYKKRRQNIKELIEFLDENIELTGDELETKDELKALNSMSYGDRSYILKKFKKSRKDMLRHLIGKNNEDTSDFYRQLKSLDTEEILAYFDQMAGEVRDYRLLNELLQNNDEDSIKKLEKLIEEGFLSESVMEYYMEASILGTSSKELMSEICEEDLDKYKKRMIVLREVSFIKANGRRPLPNSKDEKERRLSDELDNILVLLSKKEANALRSFFTTSEALKKGSAQYARNIREQEKEER